MRSPGPEEYGQIGADADCVLTLYRDDYYDADSERHGVTDIIVRKNRQGRLGRLSLDPPLFDGESSGLQI